MRLPLVVIPVALLQGCVGLETRVEVSSNFLPPRTTISLAGALDSFQQSSLSPFMPRHGRYRHEVEVRVRKKQYPRLATETRVEIKRLYHQGR